MKTIIIIILLCASGTLLAVPRHVQECMDCHAPDGISQHKDIPSIAGASADFIEETFAVYQYDLRKEVESKYRFGDTSRKATSMKQIAKKLSDAQIAEVAAYFAALPYRSVKQDFDAEKAAAGKAIHDDRCEKCHKEGGMSALQNAPILAGQWRPYLESAMTMIREGKRDIDERMNRTVKKLTDEEWDALLNYYASQQ